MGFTSPDFPVKPVPRRQAATLRRSHVETISELGPTSQVIDKRPWGELACKRDGILTLSIVTSCRRGR